MPKVKQHSTKELIKMSKEDRLDILKKAMSELAHEKLHVRAQEDKQSHNIQANKRLIARIHTLNNQPDEK